MDRRHELPSHPTLEPRRSRDNSLSELERKGRLLDACLNLLFWSLMWCLILVYLPSLCSSSSIDAVVGQARTANVACGSSRLGCGERQMISLARPDLMTPRSTSDALTSLSVICATSSCLIGRRRTMEAWVNRWIDGCGRGGAGRGAARNGGSSNARQRKDRRSQGVSRSSSSDDARRQGRSATCWAATRLLSLIPSANRFGAAAIAALLTVAIGATMEPGRCGERR